MKIPMCDLKVNYESIKSEVDEAIQTVLNKTNFVLGDDMKAFEEKFASYCNTKYAIGVANGTDALKISLLASGLKKGDEVITTPFTFIATTEAIVQSGAVPVFADIDLDTYNISPDDIEKKISNKTKAILPVHLYGHPADMKRILDIAKKHKLAVIEDCAQSFTAKYDGKVTGSLGNAGCFSFFPAKNLGCFGDGGMITTNDDNTHKNAKALRNHGSFQRYYAELHGFNSRLDTLQAVILSVKLKHIDKWTKMRNTIAQKYSNSMKTNAITPIVKNDCLHSFNYYTVRLKDKKTRDALQKHLLDNEISCQVYYPLAIHLQNVYQSLGYKKGDLPMAEKAQDVVLSLPMYPELSDKQIDFITSKVIEIIK